MSGKENELREKWNTINYYSGGALKLSVKHPLSRHKNKAAGYFS